MLCAIATAAFTGYAIGKLTFRLRGAYFVIVSISFAVVVRLVAVNWVELTQGPMALNNIPALTIGPAAIEISFLRKPAFYLLVLAVGVICYVVIARLVNSRAGRAMIALREIEVLARSLGINVTRYLGGSDDGLGGDGGHGRRAVRALHPYRRSRHVPLHLHRHDGDHGDHRRLGHTGGASGRRHGVWGCT